MRKNEFVCLIRSIISCCNFCNNKTYEWYWHSFFNFKYILQHMMATRNRPTPKLEIKLCFLSQNTFCYVTLQIPDDLMWHLAKAFLVPILSIGWIDKRFSTVPLGTQEIFEGCNQFLKLTPLCHLDSIKGAVKLLFYEAWDPRTKKKLGNTEHQN